MKRLILFFGAQVFLVLVSPGCSTPQKVGRPLPQASVAMAFIHTLSRANYPPSDRPYYIKSGDFWLVHTPEEQLFVFAPVSPPYKEEISVNECRFAWSESVQRFTDPCSGDEWQLDGRLNLVHSTELWSSNDLDQYAVTAEDGLIYIHLGQKKPGASRVASPSS